MRIRAANFINKGKDTLESMLLLGALCLLVPVFASTPNIDGTLLNALSAVNTAPLIVQRTVSTTIDSYGYNNLDCLRVLQPRDSSSPYTYLGVYHRQSGSQNPTKVGLVGSNDLRSWTIINPQLDTDYSSQADITKLPDGSYLVIYENDPSAYDTSRQGDPNFRIRHYTSYANLASGSADRQFDFDNTLSSTHCAEGTPSFRRIVSYNGGLDNSVIEIGFHYCNLDSSGKFSATTGVPDSAARGTLTNFRLWRNQDFTALNTVMRTAGVSSVGQMSTFQFRGNTYILLEGQTIFGDFGSFKLFIYNEDSNYLQKLSVTTPGGSYSIANPRLGIHYDSSGNADGIIGSYALLFASSSECNGKCPGTNEGGTFLFQQNLDNTLIDGSANPTNFAFRYNPVFAICSNGCQGVLLAGRDLIAGTNTVTDPGGVSTSVGGGQRHIVYGPYITTLPAIPLTAIFRMRLDSVASGGDHVARLEVVDSTTGTIIASRELYRRDFTQAYVNADLTLPFDWSSHSGHQVEFRVWTYDISYIKVSAVGVYLTFYTLYCPGDLSYSGNAHSTGSSCISNSATSSGNLVYGPYYFDFPGKAATATYSLRAPSGLTASGSTAVASIDVHAFNPSGKDAILASANINANQLNANYKTFTLNYDTTYYTGNGWQIETRVNVLGRGIVETQWTQVNSH